MRVPTSIATRRARLRLNFVSDTLNHIEIERLAGRRLHCQENRLCWFACNSKRVTMEFSDVPILDPRTQWFLKFLREMKRPQVFELPLEEARLMFARGQEAFALPKLPATIEEREIPVGPHGSVKLRMVRPETDDAPSGDAKLPVIVFLHGGGWVLGDAETYDVFVRQIANGAGVAVAFVEYRRAPEAHYPDPMEECYAATQWVAEHGAEL